MKKNKQFDFDTGLAIDDEEKSATQPVEPLRIPGIVEQFIGQYLPATDERTATDVMTLGELRTRLSAWFTFGSKTDVLSDYLMVLSNEGYYITDTTSGPAMCLIARDSPQVISPYQEAEDVT